MKTTKLTVLNVMNVFFGLTFIGLCIQMALILIYFFASLFVNPEVAKDVYIGLDLVDLYSFSEPYYILAV